MLELTNLRPSEYRKLGRDIAAGYSVIAFLVALRSLLEDAESDIELHQEELYVVARKLGAEGIWLNVPPSTVAPAMDGFSEAAVAAFLRGTPEGYRNEVLQGVTLRASARLKTLSPKRDFLDVMKEVQQLILAAAAENNTTRLQVKPFSHEEAAKADTSNFKTAVAVDFPWLKPVH